MYSYLSDRKQRVEINDACRSWSKILFRLSLGSILVLRYLTFSFAKYFSPFQILILQILLMTIHLSTQLKKELRNVLNDPGKESDILLKGLKELRSYNRQLFLCLPQNRRKHNRNFKLLFSKYIYNLAHQTNYPHIEKQVYCS